MAEWHSNASTDKPWTLSSLIERKVYFLSGPESCVGVGWVAVFQGWFRDTGSFHPVAPLPSTSGSHVCSVSDAWKRKMEDCEWRLLKGQSWQWHKSLLLTSHWPEFRPCLTARKVGKVWLCAQERGNEFGECITNISATAGNYNKLFLSISFCCVTNYLT